MAESSSLGSASSSGGENTFIERIGGGYRNRKQDTDDIGIEDFYNPWNFFALFMKGDSFVVQWCVRNGLMNGSLPCAVKMRNTEGILRPCPGIMNLSERTGKATGYTLRCNTNRNHEVASRKFSFFERSKLTIQDIMVFVKSYLDGNTLYKCSQLSGRPLQKNS